MKSEINSPPTVTIGDKEIGSDLRLSSVVFEYLHTTGTLDDLPEAGSQFDTGDSLLTVFKVEPMCKFLDGGQTPFIVRLHCRY